jgi:hypothetical protein
MHYGWCRQSRPNPPAVCHSTFAAEALTSAAHLGASPAMGPRNPAAADVRLDAELREARFDLGRGEPRVDRGITGRPVIMFRGCLKQLLEKHESAIWVLTRKALMSSPSDLQESICLKYSASYLPCDDSMKVGISRNFDPNQFPINGLRHSPEGDTTGWYIWSGEEFSNEPDFFVPLHAVHLNDRCPNILKYLGLGPGWRFLLAPGQEDVWFDSNLLKF